MSDSALRRRNRGSYAHPFSGVGMEFSPLGPVPPDTGFLLHEAGYLPRNRRWVFPNTISPFWRLYYNQDWGHQVVAGGRPFELGPSRLVLIPDHQLFHSVGQPPVRHFWLAFSVARRVAPGLEGPILLKPGTVERGLIASLVSLFHGIGQGDRERIFHTSLSLLHLVLSRPEFRWQPGRTSPALRQALHLVETEYFKPLRVSDLAQAAGLSVRGLSKAFRQQQGVSPAHFLTQVRVRQASGLLANTEEPIEQVAVQTGFPNRNYFSRVFQRLTGESPARFRRRYSARVGVLGPATRTLSSREIAVLDYLAKGFLYKEIAASLGISYGTIHTHIEHLYAKLGVRSRAQAVARYLHA